MLFTENTVYELYNSDKKIEIELDTRSKQLANAVLAVDLLSLAFKIASPICFAYVANQWPALTSLFRVVDDSSSTEECRLYACNNLKFFNPKCYSAVFTVADDMCQLYQKHYQALITLGKKRPFVQRKTVISTFFPSIRVQIDALYSCQSASDLAIMLENILSAQLISTIVKPIACPVFQHVYDHSTYGEDNTTILKCYFNAISDMALSTRSQSDFTVLQLQVATLISSFEFYSDYQESISDFWEKTQITITKQLENAAPPRSLFDFQPKQANASNNNDEFHFTLCGLLHALDVIPEPMSKEHHLALLKNVFFPPTAARLHEQTVTDDAIIEKMNASQKATYEQLIPERQLVNRVLDVLSIETNDDYYEHQTQIITEPVIFRMVKTLSQLAPAHNASELQRRLQPIIEKQREQGLMLYALRQQHYLLSQQHDDMTAMTVDTAMTASTLSSAVESGIFANNRRRPRDELPSSDADNGGHTAKRRRK